MNDDEFYTVTSACRHEPRLVIELLCLEQGGAETRSLLDEFLTLQTAKTEEA